LSSTCILLIFFVFRQKLAYNNIVVRVMSLLTFILLSSVIVGRTRSDGECNGLYSNFSQHLASKTPYRFVANYNTEPVNYEGKCFVGMTCVLTRRPYYANVGAIIIIVITNTTTVRVFVVHMYNVCTCLLNRHILLHSLFRMIIVVLH